MLSFWGVMQTNPDLNVCHAPWITICTLLWHSRVIVFFKRWLPMWLKCWKNWTIGTFPSSYFLFFLAPHAFVFRVRPMDGGSLRNNILETSGHETSPYSKRFPSVAAGSSNWVAGWSNYTDFHPLFYCFLQLLRDMIPWGFFLCLNIKAYIL